jgi:uncharacterized protein (DUF58 family)
VIIRPGRRLILAVGSSAVVGLVAFAWSPILWAVGAALVLTAGLSVWDARLAMAALGRIKVTRKLPLVVGRDLPFLDSIQLMNQGAGRVAGEMRDVLPAACQPAWRVLPFEVESQAAINLEIACRIPRRGRHRFGPVWVRVEGALGLVEIQQQFDCHGETKVLPETFVSREPLQKDMKAELMLLDKASRARQHGTGTEFVMLDEYRRGDDPRRIDWRSTARHGFPIVRRYQVERHREVLILIDSGRLMGTMTDRGTKLDCAVDAALNLARVALNSGDRCGIGFFDRQVRGFLPPIAGSKSMKNLVECVYDLETRWQESDFSRLFAELQQRQSKRCFLIVLSDLGDAETSRMHCAALERLNRRHLVLFAALRTPLLDRVIHSETPTVLDGARKAVATGLSRDRGRALHTLKHGGVRVLDLEPQQITVPLINQFIDLRQRNLL